MEKLISPEEVCELIPGMTKGLLAQMRYRGTGPAFMKPSRKTVVYALSDVEAYVESTKRSNSAHPVSA